MWESLSPVTTQLLAVSCCSPGPWARSSGPKHLNCQAGDLQIKENQSSSGLNWEWGKKAPNLTLLNVKVGKVMFLYSLVHKKHMFWLGDGVIKGI